MNEADTQVEETEEPSAAEEQQEQELTVPKHRLDAVSGEVKRLKEELEMKDRALTQVLGSRQPQAPAEEDDEGELEQLGLSREVTKKVKGIIGKELQKAVRQVGGHLGALSMGVDEAKFLLKHGADKDVYLEKINNLRRAHFARGSQISIEDAYKLVRFDEADGKAQAKGKKPAAPVKPATETQKAEVKKPAPGAGKSIEDWENELEEQFKASGLKSL